MGTFTQNMLLHLDTVFKCLYLLTLVYICVCAYIEDLHPQGGRLYTADEAQQKIHHGRGINVIQHQTDKVVFFP